MLAKIPRWAVLPLVMLGLAGCAGFDQRRGLAPVLDGAAVQAASYNKTVIINALAVDAGYRPGEPVDYYRIAEAGFNYVDDQCRSYFDTLFFIDRGREQFKSGLTAASATTAAILGVTHASAPSLAILAAAFGFTANVTDIVTGTYLYRLPPATTQGFVERMQLAYRIGAANSRGMINSPTSAYFHVQRYLNLCLPPTIEAEIVRQISSANAVPVPLGPGAFFSIESVGAPVSPVRRAGADRVSFVRPPSVDTSVARGSAVQQQFGQVRVRSPPAKADKPVKATRTSSTPMNSPVTARPPKPWAN
ncbi:MAG: hypothetical protein L0Y57_00500 [Beijerinckiaceae bacterium]|nr:hypothetical protein [Beijerinckiaceae bacterium]